MLAQPDGAVIDGHCRLLGVKLVDPAFLVPTIITEEMLKPAVIAQIQLVSAIQRNGLSATWHHERHRGDESRQSGFDQSGNR